MVFQREKELYYILMRFHIPRTTLASGLMERKKDLGKCSGKTETDIEATGKMTFQGAKANTAGPMGTSLLGSSRMVYPVGRECMKLKVVTFLSGTSRMVCQQDEVSLCMGKAKRSGTNI